MKTRFDRLLLGLRSLVLVAFAGLLAAPAADAHQEGKPQGGQERAAPAKKAPPKKRDDAAAARIAEAFELLAEGLRSGAITPQAAFEQARVVESGWRRASGIKPGKRAAGGTKPGAGKPSKKPMTREEAEATPRFIAFAKAMEERVTAGSLTRADADRMIANVRGQLMGLKPSAQPPGKKAAPPKIEFPPPLEKSFKERRAEKEAELRGKIAAGELTKEEAAAEREAFLAELRREVEERQKALEEAQAALKARRGKKKGPVKKKAGDTESAKGPGSGGGAPRP